MKVGGNFFKQHSSTMDYENLELTSENEETLRDKAARIVLPCLAVLVLVAIVCVKLYIKFTSGKCRSYQSMNNKTVIITGGNRGLGKETALNLALRGARVILACRNVEQGRAAAEEIIRRTGNNNIVVIHLDVSSLYSVRKFAEKINTEESRLDVLINNAGVGAFDKRTLSSDNVELTFATNYLGPFLLTTLLLDLLKKSAPSRIINVSSMVYALGKIEFGNLNSEINYSRYLTYCNSKLALNLFTKELAARLQRNNDDVTVNCLHPGIVNTDLFRNVYAPFRVILRASLWMFFKNSVEGAQTSIYLAVSDDVNGITGEYFSDCKKCALLSKSKDMTVAKRLYEVSEKWCDNREPVITVC